MKSILRKNIKLQRKQLDWQEVYEKSRLIQKRLLDLVEFKQSRSILFYAAYQKEVRTQEAIQEALKEQKRIFLPLVDTKAVCLKLVPIFNYPEDVEPGIFGIPQPREKSQTVSLESVDLVIVPGVAFDQEGNRLGYGGGYYDRLLANQYSIPLIGLAYELQIVAQIPRQSHDIRVHKVVSEKRTIICNPYNNTTINEGGGDN